MFKKIQKKLCWLVCGLISINRVDAFQETMLWHQSASKTVGALKFVCGNNSSLCRASSKDHVRFPIPSMSSSTNYKSSALSSPLLQDLDLWGSGATMDMTKKLPVSKSTPISNHHGILVQENLSLSLSRSYETVLQALVFGINSVKKTLQKTWWSLPLLLIAVPIYTFFVLGTQATMPHWWPLTNMDHVKQSKNAAVIIAMFLCSNISYFLSGSYLVRKFNNLNSSSSATTRFSRLGAWILAAGIISTIFHSVQALGSYAVAESLSYIDHGVAISAGLYFLRTCGFPSRNALYLGITGLVTLCVTNPGYTFLHSTWHFLSSGAAVVWALDGYDNQRSVPVRVIV